MMLSEYEQLPYNKGDMKDKTNKVTFVHKQRSEDIIKEDRLKLEIEGIPRQCRPEDSKVSELLNDMAIGM